MVITKHELMLQICISHNAGADLHDIPKGAPEYKDRQQKWIFEAKKLIAIVNELPLPGDNVPEQIFNID